MLGKYIRIMVMLSLLVSASGCNMDGTSKKKKKRLISPKALAHVSDTIAEYGGIVSASQAAVAGYGIVVGLGKNGSAEVPANIKNYLVEFLTKKAKLGSALENTDVLSPNRFLRDMDTAPVLIGGSIPPCAPKGTRFDVFVKTIPRTSTRRLDGGVLMPGELFLAHGGTVKPGGSGRKLASVEGGIFTNPFLNPDKASDLPALCKGRIPNGGVVVSDQPVRFHLTRPDYNIADIVQRRINERFGIDGQKIANAKNSYAIDITIPREHRKNYKHFIDLVMHLPTTSSAGTIENQARRIAVAIEMPDARYNDLALVWEAMGVQSLPVIQPLYTSSNPASAFYSARTGIRLKDIELAAPIVLRFAEMEGSPMQIPAIEELARHRNLIGAKSILRKLLDSDNSLVRIAAYESLLKQNDTTYVGRIDIAGKFKLDIVSSKKNYVIYASQSGQPRIALFGRSMPIERTIFFSAPDNSLTVNAREDDKQLSIWRKIPRTGQSSGQLQCDFNVISLVKTLCKPARPDPDGDPTEIQGLNMTYGQCISALYRLCKKNDVKAKFILQQSPEIEKMYRTLGTGERPD